MEACEGNDTFVILEDRSQESLDTCDDTNNDTTLQTSELNKTIDYSEKHSAVWTQAATRTLLELYESKLEMLETPKKKTRIWLAISESLKYHKIKMTPDQVRWKINALTRKYKQCVDSGARERFQFYKEMDNIYERYHVDCDSYTAAELLHRRKEPPTQNSYINDGKNKIPESRKTIELRKLRLKHRIETDKNQGKIHLERQWLDYLRRQEDHNKWRDDFFVRNLKLREEEVELRKKELDFKETFENKNLEIKEKEQTAMLQIEREKCELLKQLFNIKY